MKYFVSFTVSAVVEADDYGDAYDQGYALLVESREGGEITAHTVRIEDNEE